MRVCVCFVFMYVFVFACVCLCLSVSLFQCQKLIQSMERELTASDYNVEQLRKDLQESKAISEQVITCTCTCIHVVANPSIV